jgi:hypothetical protein
MTLFGITLPINTWHLTIILRAVKNSGLNVSFTQRSARALVLTDSDFNTSVTIITNIHSAVQAAKQPDERQSKTLSWALQKMMRQYSVKGLTKEVTLNAILNY